MPSLDDILPTESYSIKEFVDTAAALHEAGDISQFLQFAITGRLDGHQAVLDPLHDRLGPGRQLKVKRDYDSLLGVSSEISITAPLFVFAVGKNEDVLKTNIYIEMPIQRENVGYVFLIQIKFDDDSIGL